MDAHLGTKPHRSRNDQLEGAMFHVKVMIILPLYLWTIMSSIKLHELSRWPFFPIPAKRSDSCFDDTNLYTEMMYSLSPNLYLTRTAGVTVKSLVLFEIHSICLTRQFWNGQTTNKLFSQSPTLY